MGKLSPAEAEPVAQATQLGVVERARSRELGFSNPAARVAWEVLESRGSWAPPQMQDLGSSLQGTRGLLTYSLGSEP